MKIEIRSSFTKDSKKLSATIKEEIATAISLISAAEILLNIPNIKSIKGGKKAKNAYRMRIGDYRICFYFRNDFIELIRVLPRKDVYKVFP